MMVDYSKMTVTQINNLLKDIEVAKTFLKDLKEELILKGDVNE